MKDYFTNLFNYNDWANSLLISNLSTLHNAPENAVKLMSHIISAQDIWFERVRKNKNFSISPWDEYSIPECKILSARSTKNWINYLKRASEKNLEEKCSYFNLKGIHYEDRISEIITHILHHSSYHRGQINRVLVNSGFSAVSCDYIIYARQPD